MSATDILFEPIQLGPKTMRNRFMQVPHCNSAGSVRPHVNARFRETKAEGGWGAVFVEATQIAPEAEAEPYTVFNFWDDDDASALALVNAAVHAHAALAGVELGYWLKGAEVGGHLESRAPFRGHVNKVDQDTIRKIRQIYVDAALRAVEAGTDLITVYAAHGGNTPLQFLMPALNSRTDSYGGSFENRARFSREVMTDIREAVQGRAAVGIRFMVDSVDHPFGLGDAGVRANADGHHFIEYMDDLVDYWDINVGGYPDWGEDAASSRSHPENHEARYTRHVKAHTNKPVINVGRFTNPETMVRVIRDGQCDIIGAARPSIADPFLPKKIQEGRLEDIRECIGCNMCVARYEMGGVPLVCTQNATALEEYRRGWHPERFTVASNRDNDVLVLGAGPAGLECARVLGERRMRRVHLVDAESEIGGSIRWISRLPGLGEWARLINYRKIQIDKLKNVELITGTKLAVDDVLEYGAEIVIVATGSHWRTDGSTEGSAMTIDGANSSYPHVLTPEQIVSGQKPVGERIVVYDAEGYFMGHALATRLARAGHHVTYVTPESTVAPFTRFTLEQTRITVELNRDCQAVLTHTSLVKIDAGSVTVLDATTDLLREFPVDSVVLATGRESNDEIYRGLRERREDWSGLGITGVYRAGDCIAPDFISEAVFSGHRLAREIDSNDPSEALPYLRERARVTPAELAPSLP